MLTDLVMQTALFRLLAGFTIASYFKLPRDRAFSVMYLKRMYPTCSTKYRTEDTRQSALFK